MIILLFYFDILLISFCCLFYFLLLELLCPSKSFIITIDFFPDLNLWVLFFQALWPRTRWSSNASISVLCHTERTPWMRSRVTSSSPTLRCDWHLSPYTLPLRHSLSLHWKLKSFTSFTKCCLCVCLCFVPTAGWHNVKATVAIDFHASRSFITVMMEWQAGLKCTHDMSDHSLIIYPLRTCQSPCPTTCVKLSLTGINKHNVIYCLTCFGVHKAVIAQILSGVLWV